MDLLSFSLLMQVKEVQEILLLTQLIESSFFTQSL